MQAVCFTSVQLSEQTVVFGKPMKQKRLKSSLDSDPAAV